MLNYAFAKGGETSEMECYLDCWILFLLSRKLHENFYQGVNDSVGVFGYPDSRPEFTQIVARQFSTTL